MSVVGVPVGIAGARFTLIFSLTTGIIKKLLSITRNKKKKHDKILMLTKSKLNSIETLVSQVFNMEIRDEEFDTIMKEKKIWENLTKTALTAVENKIPDISSLVKSQIMNHRLVSLKKCNCSQPWQIFYYSRV